MTLLDRWWYFNYRWHKWRLERCMKGATAHINIIHGGLGVEKLTFNTHGLIQMFDEKGERASLPE